MGLGIRDLRCGRGDARTHHEQRDGEEVLPVELRLALRDEGVVMCSVHGRPFFVGSAWKAVQKSDCSSSPSFVATRCDRKTRSYSSCRVGARNVRFPATPFPRCSAPWLCTGLLQRDDIIQFPRLVEKRLLRA